MNNIVWWLIIFFSLLGYFIFRFGMISRGRSKYLIEFVGGIALLASFIAMLIINGVKPLLVMILIFWFAVTPIIEVLIEKLNKKLYGHYLEFEEGYAKKLGMSVDQLRETKNKTDQEILEETLPGIFSNDKKRESGFIQIPLLVMVLVSVLLASTGAGVALYKKGGLPFIPKKEVIIESTPIPTPFVEISPLPSILLKPTSDPKSQNKVENKPTTVPVINETQQTKVDAGVGIEQCRTYAKEKRKEEERKVNEEYAGSEPAMAELAAAQTNGETEAVALKYGIITQSQVVRRTEVFERLLSEGYPVGEAEKGATIAGDDYSNYLYSLHNWAVNELNKWNAVVVTRFDTYESQLYQNCLSSL